MNFNRVNYLFSEKEFDSTRDLYRAVLIAACKEASRLASLFTYYREPLTHHVCSFDLDALMEHMPVVESAIVPGRFKSQYPICDILVALRVLHDAGLIMSEDKDVREIQLETHLFKMIAEAWAISLGVTAHEIVRGEPIYAKNFQRAILIDGARDRRADAKGVCIWDRQAVIRTRKGGVAA
jgi:hypothetical protein